MGQQAVKWDYKSHPWAGPRAARETSPAMENNRKSYSFLIHFWELVKNTMCFYSRRRRAPLCAALLRPWCSAPRCSVPLALLRDMYPANVSSSLNSQNARGSQIVLIFQNSLELHNFLCFCNVPRCSEFPNGQKTSRNLGTAQPLLFPGRCWPQLPDYQ